MVMAKFLTALGPDQLDRLGDLNPQLLRELKGRLKRFPMLVAIGLSLLLQLGMMVIFSMHLPGLQAGCASKISAGNRVLMSSRSFRLLNKQATVPFASPTREAKGNTAKQTTAKP